MLMKSGLCPVPIDQIPIMEYKSLSKSKFFSWPKNKQIYFYQKLLFSWFLFLPITLIISTGSIELSQAPIKLFQFSLIFSLFMPLFLITRILLSWSYIYKRLRSEKIEYEESGWYDGQIWEKTIEMREKDMLTAQHDIKPIIDLLKQSLKITISIFLTGLLTIKFLPVH